MMTRCIPVTDTTQVATARRGAVAVAQANSFDDADVGRVALVATELATNVVRHGRGGQLLLRMVEHDLDVPTLELLALDRGPGMHDVQMCLRDGYSSAGTAGTGFGAVQRQSDTFDVYSRPGKGTGVLAGLNPRRRAPASSGNPLRHGGISIPKTGEEVCGDGWAVSVQGPVVTAMVVDGLGHGPFAADAAGQAVRVFYQRRFASPAAALLAIHTGLRATRGAALGIACIDTERSRVVFAGIGNIAGTLISGGQSRRLVSLNGIVGHATQRIQEFVYPYSGADALLILHSDGLETNWSLDPYPGLTARHPSLIAGILYRDFNRGGRDDVTVLAARSPA